MKDDFVLKDTAKHQRAGVEILDKWRPLIPPDQTLMLKTCVLDGKVRLDPNYVEYSHPNWTMPRYIVKNIERKYKLTQYGDLFITSDESGKLRHKVNVPVPAEEKTPSGFVDCEPEERVVFAGMAAKGKKRQNSCPLIPERWRGLLAPNETLMLKTCISSRKVSLDANDVEYRHPNWTIPRYIIENVERENRYTCHAELFIISDSNGHLRHVVDHCVVYCSVHLD